MSRGSNAVLADMVREGEAFNERALQHMSALDLAARLYRLSGEITDVQAAADAWEAARQKRQREYQERMS